MSAESPSHFNVTILLEEKDDVYVAECPECDLVHVAATRDLAIEQMREVIRGHAIYCRENDCLHTFHRPPNHAECERMVRAKDLRMPFYFNFDHVDVGVRTLEFAGA